KCHSHRFCCLWSQQRRRKRPLQSNRALLQTHFVLESQASEGEGTSMHATTLAMFFEFSRTATAMCATGFVVSLVGAWAAKGGFVAARGIEKVITLANLCYAVPLAVFGALHFSAPDGLVNFVPPYMPWRMFWVYFVGCALVAASLS